MFNRLLSRTPREPRSRRGQALVEFAIILPLIALLLVMAIDFGRVFFGWVGVQNAARIGANYAAMHPLDADWDDPDDPFRKEYVEQILADAAAINCALPDPVPNPMFPDGTSPGEDAVVSLTCGFVPITPLAINIVGNPLEIAAQATFPIRKGIVGMPSGGGGGEEEEEDELCRVVPNLSDMRVVDARLAWTVAGFSGAFSPASGQDSRIVVANSQVTNPASSPGQCITFEATIGVTAVIAPPCPSGQSLVPKITGLLVNQARTAWGSGFTGAFDPPSGSDDQVVTSWSTTPVFAAGTCAPSATTTVTVVHDQAPDPAPCKVPDFIGSKANQAQATWSGANFETTVQFSTSGNFTIGKQGINSGAFVSCTTTVIVLEP